MESDEEVFICHVSIEEQHSIIVAFPFSLNEPFTDG